jgi:hypothetical protein
MNFSKIIIGALIFAAQVACSGTQTTATWSNENISPQIEKVAVLSVMGRLSATQSYENEIVARMQKEGVNAIAAHRLIPPTRKQVKVDQMIRKLYAEGVDVVMVVSVSDVARSRSYIPGSSYVQPRTYYNRFGDYYVHSYRRVYSPGYIRRSTTVYLESTLYQLENQQMIWTSESKSTDPASLEGASRSYAKSIVKALEQDQII